MDSGRILRQRHVQHRHRARCQVFPQVLFLLHHERGRELQWVCEVKVINPAIYVSPHLLRRCHRRCLLIHFLGTNPIPHIPYWHNAPYTRV